MVQVYLYSFALAGTIKTTELQFKLNLSMFPRHKPVQIKHESISKPTEIPDTTIMTDDEDEDYGDSDIFNDVDLNNLELKFRDIDDIAPPRSKSNHSRRPTAVQAQPKQLET